MKIAIIDYEIGNLANVYNAWRRLGQDPVITRNPAKALQLPGKGVVEAGADADLNLFDENMNLVHVFAKGRQMMRSGQVVVKGTFEL